MRKFSKSGAFLVELILVIAFFAIAAAHCTRLFVHAHTLSTHSRDLSRAMGVFQTAAECFKAAEGDSGRVLAVLPGGVRRDAGTLVACYDENGNPTGPEDARYRMEMRLGEEGFLSFASIGVYPSDSDDPLYEGRVYAQLHAKGDGVI